jgi:hypothetical protein
MKASIERNRSMTQPPLRLFAATLALFCLAGPKARADLIQWSYNWGSTPLSVSADGASTGGISLSTPSSTATGSSDIIAANLSTFSSALPGTFDTFTNKPYSLNLSLTDTASGAAGNLTFKGLFSGALSPTSAQITNVFLSPLTQALNLGANTYSVTIGPFSPPGIPGSTNLGSIGAHVQVTSGSPPVTVPPVTVPPVTVPPTGLDQSPEPTTLVLAGLGLPLVGAARGLRWLRGRLARRQAV